MRDEMYVVEDGEESPAFASRIWRLGKLCHSLLTLIS